MKGDKIMNNALKNTFIISFFITGISIVFNVIVYILSMAYLVPIKEYLGNGDKVLSSIGFNFGYYKFHPEALSIMVKQPDFIENKFIGVMDYDYKAFLDHFNLIEIVAVTKIIAVIGLFIMLTIHLYRRGFFSFIRTED